MTKNPHRGRDFIDYLKDEGVYKEVRARMMRKYGHLINEEKVGLWEKIMRRLRSIVGLIFS